MLQSHLSMAKITEVSDPNSNPLVTGDLLINPAWSPANRTHVAIAGLFDLTGEGRDNIDEFMRNLRKEGTIIDAYLDLRNMKIKGEGMTYKTDYLILGEQPSFDERTTIKVEDQRVARKTDILKTIGDMVTKANEVGATVVPFRRFVLLTGYKLPKGVGIGGGAGYEFIRPSETLSNEKPAKAGEKPPAKENKKDTGDDK